MTATEDAVSIEMAGVPTGRLPKELFGVTLIFKDETYPDWPTPRPKHRKKRQHFLFTKKSSQKALIQRLLGLHLLPEAEVLELHGRIEWEEVSAVKVEENE